jgi:hypothetical protein
MRCPCSCRRPSTHGADACAIIRQLFPVSQSAPRKDGSIKGFSVLSERSQPAHPVAGLHAWRLTRPWLAGSPLAPALLVFLVYGLWLIGMFATGHRAIDFVMPGKKFVTASHISKVITIDPKYHYAKNGLGSDGQFFYDIAVDPVNARYYIDWPGYRYARPLYPLVARVLAFGRVDWVMFSMLITNLLALAACTWLLAAYLLRKGVSPWWSLVFSFCPGAFLGLQRDLTEPLSYALIAAAVYVFTFGGRFRLVTSGAVFALAILTRDKALIFAGIYALSLVLPHRPGELWRQWLRLLPSRMPGAALMSFVALAPYVAWQLFITHWLGASGMTSAQEVAPLSAAGVSVHHLAAMAGPYAIDLMSVVVPAAICAVVTARALFRGEWGPEVILLAVIIVVSVVTINPAYYDELFGLLRVNTGVVFSAVLCIGTFDRVTRGNRRWLKAASGFWLWLIVFYVLVGGLWLPAKTM